MRTRIAALALMLTGALFVPAAPASAGGVGSTFWFTSPSGGPYLVPGDSISSSTSVNLAYGGGRPADGPFYAYVVPRTNDWQAAPPMPAEALVVGRLDVGVPHDQMVDVGVSFTIPRVAPGAYWLEVCNRPCTATLGELWASELRIVETAAEARLRARIDRAASAAAAATQRLDTRLTRRVDRIDRESASSSTVGIWGDRVTALENRVEDLQAEATAARAAAPRYAALGAGGAVAAGLLVLASWRIGAGIRRRRELRALLTPVDAPAEVVPFELEPVE
ncbi:MAG: hypothetical protein WD770_09095 [Actinomycetota bacterium]